jgi:hypothetical protein
MQTKGEYLVVISFISIVGVGLLSMWIPSLKTVSNLLWIAVPAFWMIVMIFGDSFMSFFRWLTSESKY